MAKHAATAVVDVTTNRYLQGAFAPVCDELDVDDLRVRGRLPAGLEGTYVRNGPNPQFGPLGSYTFPYDGDGMLHAVTFDAGRARYRNRWVLTKGLLAERSAGRALYGGMFRPVAPAPQLTGIHGEPGPFKNLANTNVVRHAGKLLALGEGGLPYEITPALATVGEYDFGGALTTAVTAHPKIDPVWDELCFLATDVVPPYLVFVTVSPKGAVGHAEPVDVSDPVFIHDLVVTDQHVLFVDGPAVYDPGALARGEPALRWKETRGTRVAVMPRDGTSDDIVWIPFERCFATHFMNGYTDHDTVVVDYVHRRCLDLPFSGSSDGASAPRLHRAVIDLSRRRVEDELVDERPVDFPRINERRAGLRYRYGYASAVTRTASWRRDAAFDTLVRYDRATDATDEHIFPEGICVGEPVFAPRPDGSGENDGWVLAFTYHTARDASELVVLDAADVAAGPIAAVCLPQRVPAGLHGAWLPAT